ncbi:hypothetical protein [Tenacibaculum sp. 190524A05c]|uniref:Glycine zipper-like domain-containing protein n=1 Tax=Tenacibaculum platacis TaxID=3137852 RepID=A0ABM9P385_9FLAO
MKKLTNKKGTKLGLGIVFGCVIGILTSNIQLWFVLGIAIGAALEYSTQKKS